MIASRAVKQPAVFGSTSTPAAVEHVEDRARVVRPGPAAAARRCTCSAPDASQRARQELVVGEAAGAEDQPRPQAPGRRSRATARSRSSSLDRRDDLDLARRRAARRSASASAATTSPSTATATPRPRGRSSSELHHARHSSAGRQLAALAVDRHDHVMPPRGASANRRRRERPRGDRAVARSSAVDDELGGDRREQDPVAVVADRPVQARGSAPGPIAGRLSGVAGRSPADSSSITSSVHRRQQLERVAQQLERRRRRSPSCRTRAPPSSRRSRSARRRAARCSRRPCAARASAARAGGIVQPEDLALYWMDRDARAARGCHRARSTTGRRRRQRPPTRDRRTRRRGATPVTRSRAIVTPVTAAARAQLASGRGQRPRRSAAVSLRGSIA